MIFWYAGRKFKIFKKPLFLAFGAFFCVVLMFGHAGILKRFKGGFWRSYRVKNTAIYRRERIKKIKQKTEIKRKQKTAIFKNQNKNGNEYKNI